MNTGLKELRKSFDVNHLFVYINTDCNLACRYCNSRLLHKALRGAVLTVKRFVPAFEEFLKGARDPEVTFYGGEPLVHKARLLELVRLIKKRDRRIHINIFTNGTLLDPATAAFLREHSVNILISLDGARRSNDLNRKFAARGGSVHDLAAARVKECGVAGLAAHMVIARNNVAGLSDNVRCLSEAGYASIDWCLNARDDWSAEDAETLRRELMKVFVQYIRDVKRGAPGYVLSRLYHYGGGPRRRKAVPVLLLNDGSFRLSEDSALLEDRAAGKGRAAAPLGKGTLRYLLDAYPGLCAASAMTACRRQEALGKVQDAHDETLRFMAAKLAAHGIFSKTYGEKYPGQRA